MKYTIGIDIGGTTIKGGVVDSSGKIIYKCVQPTDANKGRDAILNNLGYIIKKLLAKFSIQNIKGIGIGCPGQVDRIKGKIISATPNLQGWAGTNVKKFINQITNGFNPIEIDNDANCYTLGEFVYGAGKGSTNMILLTFGTGIGGGIIINKQLYRGYSNYAGEFGHITINYNGHKCNCGSRGCVEEYASIRGILRTAREKMKKHNSSLKRYKILTPEIIAMESKRGDKIAIEILDKTAFYAAVLIGNIINSFNPEIIVIGGGLSKSGNLFLSMIKEYTKIFALLGSYKHTKIVLQRLKDNGGIIGASLLVDFV